MIKLDAAQLARLGSPSQGGSQPIEEWLRSLLQPGVLRLPNGLVELRGPQPVTTTLGALEKACGVATETVKQALRALEMDHWILRVDGAHTRLLGPPRFRVSVTKENIWGSVGQAIELSITDGLHPLESIDFESLRQESNHVSRRHVLSLDHAIVRWNPRLNLSGGDTLPLTPKMRLTLATGTALRFEGRPATLAQDLDAEFSSGREVISKGPIQVHFESSAAQTLPAGSVIHLDRAGLARLPNGQTGLLHPGFEAVLTHGEPIDWAADSPWLSRFKPGAPLVFLRRAIVAELHHIVHERCAGVNPVPTTAWKILLGIHECFLDASIPHTAGLSSRKQSPQALIEFLRGMKNTDSLRDSLQNRFDVSVDRADVRFSPGIAASTHDRVWLRQAACNPGLNSEVLSLGHHLPCWTQVGAYYRKGTVWPWEITREIYFTYVDVRYRQQA